MAIIPQAWTPEQDDYLTELAGDVPPAVLTSRFNEWASRHGHPSRTQSAINNRIRTLGLSAKACGNWITSGVVGNMLGLSPTCVTRMFDRCPIPRKRLGRIFYFTRADLKKWAQRYPERLGGFPRSNLIMLLESEELVDSILERFPHRHCRPIKVRFPTLGRTFNNCKAAAAALHLDHSTIPAAIKAGKYRVIGIPFEVVQ